MLPGDVSTTPLKGGDSDHEEESRQEEEMLRASLLDARRKLKGAYTQTRLALEVLDKVLSKW